MIESSSEIVLVGYENGAVTLVSEQEEAASVPEKLSQEPAVVKNDKKLEEPLMYCDLCEYRTPKRKLLIQHMTGYHFSPDRECQICGKRLNKMQLRLHMRFHDLKFVCDYCGKRFGDSRQLRKHKNSRVCGEKFQESLSYKTHKCDYCDYRTHTAKLLMAHFRTLHVPKDTTCPTCSREMTQKQYMSHKNFCNRGTFDCEFCHKRFSNPKYLKSHVKSKHEMSIRQQMPESVEIEPKTKEIVEKEKEDTPVPETNLTDEEILDDYMEVETIDEDPVTENLKIEIIMNEEENIEPEPEIVHYRCSICSTHATTLDELLEHMNLRHQFCDNECPICHKSFTKSALARHMRYHCKNHVCSKCGHAFAEANLLKAHLERKVSCLGPTLEELQRDPGYMMKQYACDLCLYRGETKKHLSRHVRNTHVVGVKEIECPECGKELTRQQWRSHRKSHIKVKCEICNKWFTDSKFFKIHMENHANPLSHLKVRDSPVENRDSTTGNFVCPDCDFQTKERRFLTQHIKIKHAPQDLECKFLECAGKKFTQTQLRLHQRFHRLPFKCEKCGNGFPDRRDLKRHTDNNRCGKERKVKVIYRVREETRPASKKIKSENIEVIDRVIIKPEPVEFRPITPDINPCTTSTPNSLGIFECFNCNYETDSKPELIEHWSQFHAPRDQPCSYPQCEGKLFSKAQLKVHMKFHKKKSDTVSSNVPKTFPRKRTRKDLVEDETTVVNLFQCVSCDFETNKKKYLEQHESMNHKSKGKSKK